jgi:membrane protease YdiL (CAAX protease family)
MTFEKLTFFDDNKLPGISDAFLLILFSALLSLVVGLIVGLLVTVIPFLNPWNIFLSYSLTFGAVFFVARFFWQSNKIDSKQVSWKVYVLVLPIIISLSVLTEGLVGLIPMPQKIQEFFASMVQLNIYGYLTIGIAAPILEELIFRGIVLKAFLKKYEPVKAIMWSAIIFGVAHMNPWQFVPAWLIGIFIGWIYWKTQSIWPGIIIHFINNTFSFALGYWARDINISFYDLSGGILNYFMLLLVCVLVSVGLILALSKYFHKQQAETIVE